MQQERRQFFTSSSSAKVGRSYTHIEGPFSNDGQHVPALICVWANWHFFMLNLTKKCLVLLAASFSIWTPKSSPPSQPLVSCPWWSVRREHWRLFLHIVSDLLFDDDHASIPNTKLTLNALSFFSRRIQRRDCWVQEHFFHRVGCRRSGQDPPSLASLLPKYAGSHLRCGFERLRPYRCRQRRVAQNAKWGRASRRSSSCFCEQAGPPQRYERCRNDRQARTSWTPPFLSSVVHPSLLCNHWRRTLRGLGLAICYPR